MRLQQCQRPIIASEALRQHQACGSNTNSGTTTSSIPARAGEPGWDGCGSRLAAVYPRACGGTVTDLVMDQEKYGLSPRVRGNHVDQKQSRPNMGSIPARAGEPSRIKGRQTLRGVYPRACGGTKQASRWPTFASGLSPRVRGNPAVACSQRTPLRSIPARAGEPDRGHRTHCRLRVYPRACGGTKSPSGPLGGANGLSPRVRGNRKAGLAI